MDDYTISRQGDVGRFLRESSMRSLALVLPTLTDIELQRVKTNAAIYRIVQQSCEKIDAVRVVSFRLLRKYSKEGRKFLILLEVSLISNILFIEFLTAF